MSYYINEQIIFLNVYYLSIVYMNIQTFLVVRVTYRKLDDTKRSLNTRFIF